MRQFLLLFLARNRCLVLGALFALTLVGPATAQQVISTTGVNAQNFDGMGSSGTASLPSGFRVNSSASWNSGTAQTGIAFGISGAGAVTGTSGGNTVNWADGVTATATDRALGFLSSGGYTVPRSIIYAFTNNTSAVVNSIDVSWNYEKYRTGSRAFDFNFFHGSNAAAIATAATGGNQAYAADAANAPVSAVTSISKSVTISGLSIAVGGTYYLCWTYNAGGSSNGQGLAIDDFTIKLNHGVVVPVPTTTSITPSSATVGSPGFTITVNGTNFVSGSSSVTWNGSPRTTTFVSATELTAAILASDIASVGSANVGVTTTGAASASNTQTFTVNPPSAPFLAVSGNTNHGSVCPTFPATTIQYTITNSGVATAQNVSVVSDNSHFVVSGLSSTTIPGSGGSVTYNVTFTPTAGGAQTANIQITSTTSGSNTVTSALTGNGITPVTPVVSTLAANAINNTVATLRGNLVTLGVCPATTEKGFFYALTSVNNNPEFSGVGATKVAVAGLATGNYTAALSNLTPATGYTYKAYVFDGTAYTYGAAESFTTLAAANHLFLGTIASTGNVGVALSSFTVTARRPDNSTDTNFTGNITISKASGPGTVTGTLTVAAVAGVATFSTVTFGAVGTYTLAASSGSLTGATSGNIVISLAPVSIFSNPISGSNPGQTSPYTAGQTVDPHLTVSGISRGPGLSSNAGNDRYNATGWTNATSPDPSDYFEFRLTPTAGYKINFTDFTYTSTASGSGPTQFTFRSSVDGFVSDLGSASASGTTIDLSAFQDVEQEITYRFYAYQSGSGTFSINDFTFRGNVLCLEPTAFNVTGTGFTCATGSLAVGLSDSQNGISYQLKQNGNNVGTAVTGTGDAITFGLQSPGTYTVEAINTLGGCNNVTVMNGNAIISVSTITTWVGSVDKSWNNAANWSCGEVPTASSDVVINIATPGGVEITSDAFANTLTIQNGALLTVLSGSDLTVTDVINGATGNFTISNNANLIQINDVDNTGLAKVKRNSSALLRQDYTLWSSPVDDQELFNFSDQTLTNRFYTYNSTNNTYVSVVNPNSTEFAEGIGYLIRMPNNHPSVTPTIWPGEFNGTLRNGDVDVTLNNGGDGFRFNAVGNPYPSAINMFTFASNNQDNITGTLYFWRKTNSSSNPTYSIWTPGGGFVGNGQPQVFNPNGVIRTGQGFLVEASETGTQLVFNNGQRTGDNANQFFRQQNEIERNRIWLNISNANGAFSQALVGYIEGSTLGNDAQIDGRFFNDGDIAFYSMIGGERFAIQGRPIPFDASDVVPMGFKAAVAGSYTISIDQVDGLFLEGQPIYVRDNLTGEVHDLNAGAYTFATGTGTFNSRFDIIYDSALSTGQPVFNSNSVVVYKQGQEFIVNSGNVEMNNIQVYDVVGKRLFEVKDIKASEVRIPVSSANQVLIFKVLSSTNAEVTKKVVN